MNIDEIYMRRALRLAKAGEGHVSPNPMVGAVIVCDGRIIGEGWHRAYGQAHAEVNAISSVRPADKPLLSKSTLYVTLEPCSHYGKTPPCSKLIIESRIPRVVVGSCDPFSKVSGKGIKMLQDAGIDVAVGILENECRNLNARFMTAHTHHRPHIILKWAESADRFVDIARVLFAGFNIRDQDTDILLPLGHVLIAYHVIRDQTTCPAFLAKLAPGRVTAMAGNDPVRAIIVRTYYGKRGQDPELLNCIFQVCQVADGEMV